MENCILKDSRMEKVVHSFHNQIEETEVEVVEVTEMEVVEVKVIEMEVVEVKVIEVEVIEVEMIVGRSRTPNSNFLQAP